MKHQNLASKNSLLGVWIWTWTFQLDDLKVSPALQMALGLASSPLHSSCTWLWSSSCSVTLHRFYWRKATCSLHFEGSHLRFAWPGASSFLPLFPNLSLSLLHFSAWGGMSLPWSMLPQHRCTCLGGEERNGLYVSSATSSESFAMSTWHIVNTQWIFPQRTCDGTVASVGDTSLKKCVGLKFPGRW